MAQLITNDTFVIKEQADLEKVLQRLKDFANDENYVKPQILTEREKKNLANQPVSENKLSKHISNPDFSQFIKINYI